MNRLTILCAFLLSLPWVMPIGVIIHESAHALMSLWLGYPVTGIAIGINSASAPFPYPLGVWGLTFFGAPAPQGITRILVDIAPYGTFILLGLVALRLKNRPVSAFLAGELFWNNLYPYTLAGDWQHVALLMSDQILGYAYLFALSFLVTMTIMVANAKIAVRADGKST